MPALLKPLYSSTRPCALRLLTRASVSWTEVPSSVVGFPRKPSIFFLQFTFCDSAFREQSDTENAINSSCHSQHSSTNHSLNFICDVMTSDTQKLFQVRKLFVLQCTTCNPRESLESPANYRSCRYLHRAVRGRVPGLLHHCRLPEDRIFVAQEGLSVNCVHPTTEILITGQEGKVLTEGVFVTSGQHQISMKTNPRQQIFSWDACMVHYH